MKITIIIINLSYIFGLSKCSILNFNSFTNYSIENAVCENKSICFGKIDIDNGMIFSSNVIINEPLDDTDRILMRNIIKSYYKSNIADVYIPVLNNRSLCRKQIKQWRKSVENSDDWALEMVDSWGKIPDGIFSGMVDVPGLYDQCIYASSEEYKITGKYCSVYYVNENSNKISSYRELQSRLGVLSGHKQGDFTPDYNTYGTCVPNSCSNKDMEDGLARALWKSKKKILRVSCSNNESFFAKLSFGGYLFLLYIGILSLIMLVAFFFTVTNHKPKKGIESIICTFCPLTNLKKIFTLDNSNKQESIKCLHGLRVITMISIHVCHELGMTVHASNIVSSYVMKETSLSLAYIVTSASLGVDTFLFISGLLISYSTLKKLHKPNKVKPINFYVYRFIRLTPPIVVVTWFFATIGGHLMAGPWDSEYGLIENACKKYWWKDVFYVFNFFPLANSNEAFPTCIGQSWYTAVDFQIFILAPFLIYLILQYPSKGQIIIISSTILFFIIPTIFIYKYNLAPTNIIKLESDKNTAYYLNIYLMPWHRAAPWFVGFSTGYLLITSKITGQLNKWTVITGWSCSIIFGSGVIYRMVELNMNPSSYEDMGDVTKALFGGTHRGIWALALAWIVYACQNKHGGLAHFLEYPGFQPLNRLSYSVFLVSLNIQFALSWNSKRPAHVSVFSKVLESFGSFVVCIIAAVLLSLLTESPTLRLMRKSNKNE